MENREGLIWAAAGFLIALVVVAPGKGKYQVISNGNNVVTILNTETGQAWLTKVDQEGYYAEGSKLKGLFYTNYYDRYNLDIAPVTELTPYEGSWWKWLKYKLNIKGLMLRLNS